MTKPTLFTLPPREPRPDTQETRCRMCYAYRCAYCIRFGLPICFDDGHTLLWRDNQPIQCDGRAWRYLEPTP